MAIVRWDPFGEMLSMQRDMERVFGRLGMGRAAQEGAEAAAWMPRVDVKSTGDDLTVFAELPGLSRDDIDVEITDGILTITGERRSESESSDEGWLIQERSYGSFERSLVLPEGVEPENITADYNDGVLEIHIPKALEELKPKTHRVSLSSGGATGGSRTETVQEAPEGAEPDSEESEPVS